MVYSRVIGYGSFQVLRQPVEVVPKLLELGVGHPGPGDTSRVLETSVFSTTSWVRGFYNQLGPEEGDINLLQRGEAVQQRPAPSSAVRILIRATAVRNPDCASSCGGAGVDSIWGMFRHRASRQHLEWETWNACRFIDLNTFEFLLLVGLFLLSDDIPYRDLLRRFKSKVCRKLQTV